MKYTVETDLSNFDFWSGAEDNAKKLTTEQLDNIESQLPDLFAETPTETEINDLFWFDFDTVLSLIGLTENDDGEIVEND